ncbi:MAG TPA: LysR substrate-binding domain-containing protein [Geothrix sp.]|uniref:LysR substrate-binding domain-containing protein n=1 Tax=Geothrix mesophila TaxID=2922723 RepID=UPI001FAC9BF6|nr:LysR substrate-binding domain-containing protein [Geothrix sp. SG198]HJV38061.1 LysR substrate-binding domain-containing protein [Geothrix sp.]
MELRLLRYFTVVAEELHFSRAAARLHMAQPPLSQQIKQLEQELGVPLFVRTRRHVELTEPGRQFLGSAREILAQVDHAVLQVQRAARGEVGEIAIGLVSSASYEDTLPRILRAYRERHPAVAITLHEMSSGEQVAALREGRIQVGLLRPPIHEPGLATTTVLREPLVAVLPADHRLAGRRRIPLAALAGDPFIMIPRSHGLGILDLVMGACLAAGFTPRIAQEAKEIQTVVGFVAAGYGVSLMPRAVRRLSHAGVAYVPLAPPQVQIEVAAAYRQGDESPLLAAFLAVLKEGSLRGALAKSGL